MKKLAILFVLIAVFVYSGLLAPVEAVEPGNPTIGCAVGSINTALGCIPVYPPQRLALFILERSMGIAGGIALLMIGYSGIQIMTSGGDPGKMQQGKSLLTAAISGLLLLIFGVFIIRIIGQDILGIKLS